MYPQEWDQISTMKLSKPVTTALSLLRAASTKYSIWLLPIDMTAATSAGYSITDTKLLRLGQIQFMQYDSVLYVQTPGLLLDTGKLDDILLSRPLPLRYDKGRRESFNNEAWIPLPLRAERDATPATSKQEGIFRMWRSRDSGNSRRVRGLSNRPGTVIMIPVNN